MNDHLLHLYPELLRKIAAGERLGLTQEDAQEKIAATALVVETIENEITQENPELLKEAIGLEIGLGSALIGGLGGAALKDPIKRALQKLRGDPGLPEETAELMKSFRNLMKAKDIQEGVTRKAVGAGLLGVGAGALAMKMLNHKSDESLKAAAFPEEVREKMEGLKDKAEQKADSKGDEKSEEKGEKSEEKSDGKKPNPFQKKDDKSDDDKKSDEKKDEKSEDKKDDKKAPPFAKKDDAKSEEKSDEKSEDKKDADEKDSTAPVAPTVKTARALLGKILASLK